MAVIDMKVLHSRWKLHVAPEDVSPNMRRIVGRSKSSLRRNDTPVGFPNQPRACAQPARQLMRQNRRARLPVVKNEPGRRPVVRLPLSRRGNHTAFTTLVPAASPPQKSPSRAMPGLRINAQPLRS